MNGFKKLINFYFRFHFEISIFDKLIAFFMQFAINGKNPSILNARFGRYSYIMSHGFV